MSSSWNYKFKSINYQFLNSAARKLKADKVCKTWMWFLKLNHVHDNESETLLSISIHCSGFSVWFSSSVSKEWISAFILQTLSLPFVFQPEIVSAGVWIFHLYATREKNAVSHVGIDFWDKCGLNVSGENNEVVKKEIPTQVKHLMESNYSKQEASKWTKISKQKMHETHLEKKYYL